MKKIYIFFFSGTGNAKRIALWISQFAVARNIECHLLNISNTDVHNLKAPDQNSLIIFISPVHGFNYPKITIDFIRHFPKGTNKVVLMNTRAGMKIGNWVTPGLSGITFFLSGFWLRLKGYTITGEIPFDMPSNWLSLHPALNNKTVLFIHKKMYEKTLRCFRNLEEGKPLFLSRKELLQNLLVSPVSILYFLVGRFVIAKTFYASPACDHCGICIKECPVSAIKLINGHPFWTIHCESCMHCMNHCPSNAIQTSHGLVAITTVFYLLVTGVLYKYLLHEMIASSVLRFLLSNLLFFVLLLVLYRIQHFALKNKLLAGIIQHTSLTFYKWWGRYKSVPDQQWQK